MNVYLINGPSGSGKSSIGNELQKRGYKVIDTDEELGYYANLETNKEVVFPGKNVAEEWYSQNGWIWNKLRVEEVLDGATETTFFCGGALNENIFYPHFTQIFRLMIDSDTLVRRIKNRGDDQNTNNPDFISRMLRFLQTAKSDGEKSGMIIVDTSSKSIRESTDELLSYLKE